MEGKLETIEEARAAYPDAALVEKTLFGTDEVVVRQLVIPGGSDDGRHAQVVWEDPTLADALDDGPREKRERPLSRPQRAMLDALEFAAGDRTLGALAARAGTTKSGARRTLRTLEERGLAREQFNGTFSGVSC